jgi:acyl-CoA synthetase (AMP-forming)/AMP-acid ligase II
MIEVDSTAETASPRRVPLTADEPATLTEVYEQAARKHPKSDTLNFKRDGQWRAMSAEEMLRRARHVALGL